MNPSRETTAPMIVLPMISSLSVAIVRHNRSIRRPPRLE
jgi:hypothetical protein